MTDADQVAAENWPFRFRRERYPSRTSGAVRDDSSLRPTDAANVVALTPDR